MTEGRSGQQMVPPGREIRRAVYDAQDRIISYGDFEYEFHPNGELATKTDIVTNEVTSYTYDALGNLRGVALPSGDVLEYLVDGRGRRVGKKVNGVLVKQWLWRGQLQPVAELGGAGNVVARFVYAGGVNVPALMVTSTATYKLVRDHLGSVRKVIDASSGAVVQEISYDAWGRVLSDTSPGLQPFGFAGGIVDEHTDLVRFGARDFDPDLGRWTSKDPIRFDGGDNLYRYSSGDPVNRRDPRGLLDGGSGYGAGEDRPMDSLDEDDTTDLIEDEDLSSVLGYLLGASSALGGCVDDPYRKSGRPKDPDYSHCGKTKNNFKCQNCCIDACGAANEQCINRCVDISQCNGKPKTTFDNVK